MSRLWPKNGKDNAYFEGMKNMYAANWQSKTTQLLVELDSIDEDGKKTAIFLDQDKGGFLIARNCRIETRTSGWETVSELVADDPERFEKATDAFARWLEIAG